MFRDLITYNGPVDRSRLSIGVIVFGLNAPYARSVPQVSGQMPHDCFYTFHLSMLGHLTWCIEDMMNSYSLFYFLFLGVQATVVCQSVAVGTTAPPAPHLFSSTPVKTFRAAKRPRLEFEEEQIEDISAVSIEPGSSYNPAESVTTETESSQLL